MCSPGWLLDEDWVGSEELAEGVKKIERTTFGLTLGPAIGSCGDQSERAGSHKQLPMQSAWQSAGKGTALMLP